MLTSHMTRDDENRKIAAIVCSAGAGVQAVLFTDYNIPSGDDPHVFTEVQTAWKKWVRSIGSDGSTPQPPKQSDAPIPTGGA
jgi:hypothetical protein